MVSIASLIELQGKLHPDKTAIQYNEQAVTFGMVAAGSIAAAQYMGALFERQRTPVGVLVENPIRHALLVLALNRMGIAAASLRQSTLSGAVSLGIQDVLAEADVPGFRTVPVRSEMFAAPFVPPGGQWVDVRSSEVALIEFTSGSTGLPKPIGLTNSAVIAQTMNRILAYGLGGGTSLCMFRVTANVGFGFLLSRLVQGFAVAFTDSNDGVISLLEQFAIPHLIGGPAQILGVCARLGTTGRRLNGVETVILAGGAVTEADLREIRMRIGGDIRIDYGSSETGPLAMAAGGLLFGEGGNEIRLAPHQDIRIEQHDGKESGVGMVLARSSGMAVSLGVGGQVEPTNEWFATGDLGVIDAAGFLHLAGRSDDLLNLGGIKRNPEAIESNLRERGVLDAALVGAELTGGRPCVAAYLVTADEATFLEASDWLRANLPASADLRIVRLSSIARTDSGKLDRVFLRRLASHEEGTLPVAG
jgi:acyl-CoA synthetase (AMP-forming)/AMP-acid ligase II